MKKILVCLLLFCLAASCALADGTWTCPTCGSQNTGNFCGNDGTKRPVDIVCPKCGVVLPIDAGYKFCPECGQSLTSSAQTATIPQPTATPVPVQQNSIVVSSRVSTDKGHVTVTWTDADNAPPYTVSYRYIDSNSSVFQTKWRLGETSTNSFVIDWLIPGKQYEIYVENNRGMQGTATILAPALGTFSDGLLTTKSIRVTISPRYKASESVENKNASKLSRLEAQDIVAGMGTAQYGFQYRFDYPALAKSRHYDTMLAIYAPNGYADTIYIGNTEYRRYDSSGGYIYWYFLGSSFFESLYDACSEIPTGKYTIEAYWDGMLCNTSSFTVY